MTDTTQQQHYRPERQENAASAGTEAGQDAERYRAFVRSSAEGIWRFEVREPMPVDGSLSEDAQIDHFYRVNSLAECNDAMARMYGFERAEELTGRPLAEILPREVPENERLLRDFIRGGYRQTDGLSREFTRSGDERFFLNNQTGIIENGFLVRVWGTQRDITEQKRTEADLRVRLRYEEALAACSKTLLVNVSEEESLPRVLDYLRRASAVSRVYIFENFPDPEQGVCARQTHEVCAPSVVPQIGNPDLQHVPYDAVIPRWKTALENHEPVYGLVESFPANEREILEPQEIQSILALPIHSSGRWHGFIGFDDVTQRREWQERDVRLLQTVAEMIGAFIERQRAAAVLREQQRATFLFLRDVLALVSENRLHLCAESSELPAPLPATVETLTLSPEMLRVLRHRVEDEARQRGMTPDVRRLDLASAANEAGMNALVHGGGGTARVRTSGQSSEGVIQVWVEDRGPGIPLEYLHRATLERGYSSAGTLGHGFWIMLQSVDRLYLLTGPSGTTVVLEQDICASPAQMHCL